MIERIKIIFLFYFFILCRSIVVMGWQRHSGRRNGTLGRNFEIVSLLETKRFELSSGDRGFAESDRRGESVAFRARDGGAARPQRFAPTDISFSRNHGNSIIAFLLPDTSSFSSFIAENHLHLPRNRDAFTIDFAHPGLQFNDVSLVILFVPLTRIMTFDDSLA